MPLRITSRFWVKILHCTICDRSVIACCLNTNIRLKIVYSLPYAGVNYNACKNVSKVKKILTDYCGQKVKY